MLEVTRCYVDLKTEYHSMHLATIYMYILVWHCQSYDSVTCKRKLTRSPRWLMFPVYMILNITIRGHSVNF